MLTSLAPLALAVVTTFAAVDPPAQLPTRAHERTLARALAAAAIGPEAAAPAEGAAAPAVDPLDVPSVYTEKSALQLHDEGQPIRLLAGGSLSLVSMFVSTSVVGFAALALGFSESATMGGVVTTMVIGGALVPLVGAGTMVLVGGQFGGRGTITRPWLYGLAGAAVSVGATWIVSEAAGPDAAFLTGLLSIPLLTGGGVIIGYELSSEGEARRLDRRYGREPVSLVPVVAPTKDGAIAGLALAF
jgi:hypothetical protein